MNISSGQVPEVLTRTGRLIADQPVSQPARDAGRALDAFGGCELPRLPRRTVPVSPTRHYPVRMAEHTERAPEPGEVQAILESDLPREGKLAELSKLILGTDEAASAPELFAALRGFGPADRVNHAA